MDLFRGYVKVDGKRATQPWKEGKLLTLEQAQQCNEYAGVLKNGIIVVDVDHGTQSEILAKIIKDRKIKCKIIQTARGKHFYFNGDRGLNCKTAVKTACGLTVDFKVGSSNSYAVLKKDGVERKIEYDTQEYEELPAWLLPIGNYDVDFLKMDEGSRNSELYKYILKLQAIGLTKEEGREAIWIINEYLLKNKLDDDEIRTITRDEAWTGEGFYEKNKFCHDKFANWLIAEENIRKINGQLHIYERGVYVPGQERIEQAMIRHIPSIKDQMRREVLKYLNIVLENEHQVIDARYIAFKNGILDITTDSLLDFTPDIIVTNKIPYNYNPEAKSEIIDKTLDKLACKNKSVRMLLEECAGYMLFRKSELGKAFILLGDHENGKSTFLQVCQQMLGDENVSSLEMQEIGEKFNTAMLAGKLANIGDDISDDFMRGRDISLFKKVVTGNRIKGELKGQQPFEFEPYAKLIFSANSIPRTKDMTGAVLRRLIIIPFRATFSKNDPDYDPWIKYKLCEPAALEYMLYLGVQALKRVIINKQFTDCEIVEQELRDYELENNPVLSFVNDLGEGRIEGCSVKDLYAKYSTYCQSNNYNALTPIQFGKLIRRKFNLINKNVTMNGRTFYVYEKKL